MPQVSYPGVYIQEVASGVRTITSVSTSVTAFIDFFKEGPLDKAVQIFGMTDFERIYGGLDDRSEGSYAISQFFLNGGGEALIIRVAKNTVTNPLKKAAVKIKVDATGPGAVSMEVRAINEGVWGNNLRVAIDHNVPNQTTPPTLFNMYVTRYASTSPKASALVTEKYLNLSMVSASPRYFKSVIENESKLVRVVHTSFGTADETKVPAAVGTISGDLTSLTQANFDSMSGKKLKIKIGGSLVKDATLATWAAGVVKNLRDFRGHLQNALRAADTTSASFTGVSVEVVGNRLAVTSGKGGDAYTPIELIDLTDFGGGDTTASALLKLTAATGLGNNIQEYELGLAPGADVGALKKMLAADTTGVGGDGEKPGPDEIIGSQAVEPHTGMYALDYADLFNILCIPRAADLTDTEMATVVSKALAYCGEERAFMIIDIPSTINEVQEMKDWLDARANFRNKNAAIYFPRPKMPDPKNEYRLRSVGASGTMAGVYARTDSSRGVWKTPAGIEAGLNGVPELDTKLTDAQNGTLNPLGINCLRTFPIYGNIAWGGRTLEGADAIGSEWKYVAVRRLALNIEESLFRGTKWVVFEGNDEPLWAKIRLNVGAYMQSLFRQGAFQGTNPKDAFYVKCDKETTTQDDINKGIVNIEVGFAPLKPAEFVVIKIQQIAGDL